MADEQSPSSPEELGKLDRDSIEGEDELVEQAIRDAKNDVYEYEGKKYTAHPVATLFPLITGEEFKALVVSLKHNGMRQPIVLLGDQIVDGRNRFRAAKEAGVKIIFKQMDPGEDPCVIAMDLNIHRRDLRSRRVAVASAVRRMALRLEALRVEAMERAAREQQEKEDAEAQPAGSAGGDSSPAGSAGDSLKPAGSGVDVGEVLATDVEAAAAVAAGGKKTPSPLGNPSSPLASRENAAAAAGVSRSSLDRFDKMARRAPELQKPVAEGQLSVTDAAVVSEEDPELRRQVVEDVREGRAKTGAQAIEQRTGRAPRARSRAKKPGGARAKRDEGGAGLPPLPTVGGAADGKDAAGSGAAAPAAGGDAAPQPSRQVLTDLAMSPSLLLAGVRNVMPVINLDPCSSEIGNGKVRALKYLTREDDGCQKAWNADDVYLFPPPKFAGRFASKLMGEMFAGRVKRALFLAPSDLSDQDEGVLLRSDQLTGIVYETERTSFDVEGGGGQVKAPSRMVLYVFGIDRKKLYAAFDSWGKVLTVAGGR